MSHTHYVTLYYYYYNYSPAPGLRIWHKPDKAKWNLIPPILTHLYFYTGQKAKQVTNIRKKKKEKRERKTFFTRFFIYCMTFQPQHLVNNLIVQVVRHRESEEWYSYNRGKKIKEKIDDLMSAFRPYSTEELKNSVM